MTTQAPATQETKPTEASAPAPAAAQPKPAPPPPAKLERDSSILDSLMDQPIKFRMALEPTTFDEGWRVATIAARQRLCGVTSPDDAYVRILWGRSIGLPAMASIQGIALIHQKKTDSYVPCMYAKLKVALCLSRPDKIEFIRPVEETPLKASWVIKRRDRPDVERYEFTMEMAKTAGYVGRGGGADGGNNYDLHPGSMLCWRAAGRLVDRVAGDLLNGIATREDIEDSNDAPDAAPVEPKQPAQSAPLRDFAKEAEDLKGTVVSSYGPANKDERQAIRQRLETFKQEAGPFYAEPVIEAYNEEAKKARATAAAPTAQPQTTLTGT